MTIEEPTGTLPRLYYLDWLRVLVILNLIPTHASWLITYVPGFSDIPKEGLGTSVLKYYLSFVAYWHMPLLFFLTGTTASISLRHRSNREYVLERVRRLLVPLIFFVLFLWPVALYFFPQSSDSRSLSDYLFRFWLQCLKEPHIGHYVVQFRHGILGESVLFCLLSFAATIGIYELIRRTKITRILFGMKA